MKKVLMCFFISILFFGSYTYASSKDDISLIKKYYIHIDKGEFSDAARISDSKIDQLKKNYTNIRSIYPIFIQENSGKFTFYVVIVNDNPNSNYETETYKVSKKVVKGRVIHISSKKVIANKSDDKIQYLHNDDVGVSIKNILLKDLDFLYRNESKSNLLLGKNTKRDAIYQNLFQKKFTAKTSVVQYTFTWKGGEYIDDMKSDPLISKEDKINPKFISYSYYLIPNGMNYTSKNEAYADLGPSEIEGLGGPSIEHVNKKYILLEQTIQGMIIYTSELLRDLLHPVVQLKPDIHITK